MQVNLIVSMLRSHQFDKARSVFNKIKSGNKHPALLGVSAYFSMQDKKFEETLA